MMTEDELQAVLDNEMLDDAAATLLLQQQHGGLVLRGSSRRPHEPLHEAEQTTATAQTLPRSQITSGGSSRADAEGRREERRTINSHPPLRKVPKAGRDVKALSNLCQSF